MRTLIAVISYQGDSENGNHDRIRETWGKDVNAAGADLFFFVGRRSREFYLSNDEVPVIWQESRACNHAWWSSVEDCCEDFWQVLTKNILRWSLDSGYDFTYLCENDTFIVPRKLMASGFEKYDLSGHFIPADGITTRFDWPEPSGYFVSAKAAKALLNARPTHESVGLYAGQALGPFIAEGFLTKAELPIWQNGQWHFRVETGDGYPPGSPWMREMYERYGRQR
jgi:hypothetical protein